MMLICWKVKRRRLRSWWRTNMNTTTAMTRTMAATMMTVIGIDMANTVVKEPREGQWGGGGGEIQTEGQKGGREGGGEIKELPLHKHNIFMIMQTVQHCYIIVTAILLEVWGVGDVGAGGTGVGGAGGRRMEVEAMHTTLLHWQRSNGILVYGKTVMPGRT